MKPAGARGRGAHGRGDGARKRGRSPDAGLTDAGTEPGSGDGARSSRTRGRSRSREGTEAQTPGAGRSRSGSACPEKEEEMGPEGWWSRIPRLRCPGVGGDGPGWLVEPDPAGTEGPEPELAGAGSRGDGARGDGGRGDGAGTGSPEGGARGRGELAGGASCGRGELAGTKAETKPEPGGDGAGPCVPGEAGGDGLLVLSASGKEEETGPHRGFGVRKGGRGGLTREAETHGDEGLAGASGAGSSRLHGDGREGDPRGCMKTGVLPCLRKSRGCMETGERRAPRGSWEEGP